MQKIAIFLSDIAKICDFCFSNGCAFVYLLVIKNEKSKLMVNVFINVISTQSNILKTHFIADHTKILDSIF